MLLGVSPRPSRRGAAAAAAAVALALLASPVSAGLFDVDFDLNTAPGAENALRNKAYLPAQICGIVGAYIVCVLFVGTALLTYGRKMRRSVGGQHIDVVKVNEANGFEMTPVSPSSTRGRWWPKSPTKISHAFKKSQTSLNHSVPTSPISPGAESMASFDQHFLKNQQETRQREMERLYAAVMEHDDKKNNSRVTQDSDEDVEEEAAREDVVLPAAPQKADRRPPALNTATANNLAVPMPQSSNPTSPTSPRSPIRAIYPPESPMAAARRAPYGQPAPPPVHIHTHNLPLRESAPASPRSILSRARTPSTSSTNSKSKTRRSIRNLRISSPMARYGRGSGDAGDDEAHTPLSPRFYNPGPPPPTPPSAAPSATPTTPSTGDALGPFRYEIEEPLPPTPRGPVPRPAPQRSDSSRSQGAGAGAAVTSPGLPASPASAKRAGFNFPAGVPPRTAGTPGAHARSAASSTSTLPLRNMGGGADETYGGGFTKTTVLERRRDDLDPRLGRLRSPGTGGVPMTPYSPYMPFTPVTPVTPHLVTRKERKARAKEERRGRGAVHEGDEVGDVDWGDAY